MAFGGRAGRADHVDAAEAGLQVARISRPQMWHAPTSSPAGSSMAGPPQASDEQQSVCPIAVLMLIRRRLFGDAALGGPGAAELFHDWGGSDGHAT
jgi:hypothetical protein